MDLNLYPVVLTPIINATLNQPPEPVWIPLISPLSVLAGTFVGVFASLLSLRLKEKQDKRNMRRLIVSRLRGCQSLLSNLYLTYGIAFIETQCNGAISKRNLEYLKVRVQDPTELDKPIRESQAYDQYQKAYERTIILHLELAKCLKDLFEIIGLVETLFLITGTLFKKISLIIEMDTEYNKIIGSKIDSAPDEWMNAKEAEIRAFLANKMNPAIDDLIYNLNTEIKKDDAISWWQFWK